MEEINVYRIALALLAYSFFIHILWSGRKIKQLVKINKRNSKEPDDIDTYYPGKSKFIAEHNVGSDFVTIQLRTSNGHRTKIQITVDDYKRFCRSMDRESRVTCNRLIIAFDVEGEQQS